MHFRHHCGHANKIGSLPEILVPNTGRSRGAKEQIYSITFRASFRRIGSETKLIINDGQQGRKSFGVIRRSSKRWPGRMLGLSSCMPARSGR